MSTKLIFDAATPDALRNGRVRFKPGIPASGANTAVAPVIEKLNGVGTSASWVATSQAEQKAAFSALVREAQTAPSALSTSARKWLVENIDHPDFLGHFGTSTTDVATKEAIANIKGAIQFADTQHAAFDADAFKRGVLQYDKLGESLLSPKTIADAEAAGVKLSEMSVMRADVKTLKGLLKVTDGKPINRKAVEDLIIKHHGSADVLIEAAGNPEAHAYFTHNHGGDLNHFANEVKTNVGSVEAEIRSGITTVNAEVEGLKDLKEAKATQAEIEAAQKRVTEAKSAIKSSIAKPEGAEAMKLLHADEGFAEEYSKARSAVPELESAAKKAASAIKSAANAAAKAIDTGKGSWFTKSAEQISELAAKEGKTIGYLGRRTTGGKVFLGAAAAAGAYGLFSVIAGTGNKGPGERAEAVNRSRENEPATGRA